MLSNPPDGTPPDPIEHSTTVVPAATQVVVERASEKRKKINRGVNRGKRGRPHVKPRIDVKEIESAAQAQFTLEQIAALTGVSVSTLQRNFDHLLKKGGARTALSLRQRLIVEAHQGNTAALIFACKTMAGLKEGVEVTGPGGGAITVRHEDKVKVDLDQLARDLEQYASENADRRVRENSSPESVHPGNAAPTAGARPQLPGS
jgi:AraC-like DNA-binding protein